VIKKMINTKYKLNTTMTAIFKYLLLALVMIYILFPFAWLVVNSFKSMKEIFASTPSWVIKNFTLDHYRWMLRSDGTGGNLLLYLYNSMVITLSAMGLTMFFALSSGYAIARYKFPGLGLFLGLLFITQMFQGPLIMIPWYKMASFFRILDTKLVLVLIYGTITIPIAVFTMSGFFKSIPTELEEAAYIDGCTKLKTLMKIDLPLVKPGMVAVAVFSFILTWNDYQYALILTSSSRSKTVQIIINDLIQAIGNIDWGGLMAGAVIITIPVVVLFGFAQKFLVEGLVSGAVKG
jgi:multiple sugar transport system permease protein